MQSEAQRRNGSGKGLELGTAVTVDDIPAYRRTDILQTTGFNVVC